MIRQFANRLLTTRFVALPQYLSSSHHAPVPEKLEKFTNTTVKFNVKNSEGQWEQIHAVVGESFLTAILRYKVEGSYHIRMCQGSDALYPPHIRPHDPYSQGPNCGVCRIILCDNWYNKILDETDGMSKQEEVELSQFSDERSDTRLACCIPVEKWMDGCTFMIYPPPELSQVTELI